MADKEVLDAILAELKGIKNAVSEIKTQQEEDHLILKALEHNSNVNKAEHDKMNNDIVHIKGDVEALRKDISTVEVVTASNYAYIAELKAVK